MLRRIFISLFVLSPVAWGQDGVLHRGGLGDPTTLDSQAAGSGAERTITADLFTGLLTTGPAGQVVNGAAESWSVSSDGKIYRFTLRRGLRWSDGAPLTADDFVYGLRRLMDPKTASGVASFLFGVENAEAVNRGEKPIESLGVRVVGEFDIEVRLHAPTPYFPEMVAAAWDPAPKHVIQLHGKEWARPGTHVSNGAFKLVEWVPSQYVRLARNEYFYEAEAVRLREVYHYPAEDLSTALKQFRAGELDVVSAFPNQQLDWVRENLPESLRVTPTTRTETFLFNTTRPPFDDVRVRRALSMAIDREILVTKVLKGGELPAFTIVPPAAANYPARAQEPFAALAHSERMQEARRLLAAAGFGPDTPLEFELRLNASESRKQVAVAVASMWKPLGVRVRLVTSEDKARLSDMRSGSFDVIMSLRLTGSLDPYLFLHPFSTLAGSLNTTRYRNEAYDGYLQRAVQTADLRTRAGLLRQAESQLLRDQPVAAIYLYSSKMLVSPKVAGWIDNPQGLNLSRYLSLD